MPAATLQNVLGSPRFEPLRVLGEGGSGIVYEVRIRSGIADTPSRVALKVLRAELAPSERERRRFLEEAERMQRVDAPGLVKLLEAGLLPDGRPYLAMPLLDGETLAERLRRGPLPAAVAVRYFEILARAVHSLHTAGMVHRDVKPENVLVVDDAPVLLDFGIARDIDDDTTTTAAEGRVRGTPAYMAPERFFGAPASVRSDVYELGVVLYTMLVGRLPWGSEKNVTERLNPASPRDVGADVSRALATTILRALSTRPEMRPASAIELARDVAAAAADASSPSRRTMDVAIEEPPPSSRPDHVSSETAALSLGVSSPRREPPGRHLGRTLAIAAVTCVVAGVVAFGARATGMGAPSSERSPERSTATAQPAEPPATTAVGRATDATTASGVVAIPAPLPLPSSSSSSSPAAKRRASARPTSAPTPSATAHAAGPSSATILSGRGAESSGARNRETSPSSAGTPDPARYFEDRR